MLSRLEQMRKDRKEPEFHPEMPDVVAPHVLAYLFEVGPVAITPMGSSPLSHSELRTWQQNTGVELASWEARFLRRLSMEYLVASKKAESPDAKAPWNPEGAAIDRRAVAEQMRASITGLTKL